MAIWNLSMFRRSSILAVIDSLTDIDCGFKRRHAPAPDKGKSSGADGGAIFG
jgi:hypothetical protein